MKNLSDIFFHNATGAFVYGRVKALGICNAFRTEFT